MMEIKKHQPHYDIVQGQPLDQPHLRCEPGVHTPTYPNKQLCPPLDQKTIIEEDNMTKYITDTMDSDLHGKVLRDS